MKSSEIRAILALPVMLLGMPFFLIGGFFIEISSAILSWDTHGFFNLKSTHDLDSKNQWIPRRSNWWRKALVPLRFVIGWILFGLSWPVGMGGFWILIFADWIQYNR